MFSSSPLFAETLIQVKKILKYDVAAIWRMLYFKFIEIISHKSKVEFGAVRNKKNLSLIFGSNVTLKLMLLIKEMCVCRRTNWFLIRFFAARNLIIVVLWCQNILTCVAYWYVSSASEIFIIVIGKVYSISLVDMIRYLVWNKQICDMGQEIYLPKLKKP